MGWDWFPTIRDEESGEDEPCDHNWEQTDTGRTSVGEINMSHPDVFTILTREYVKTATCSKCEMKWEMAPMKGYWWVEGTTKRHYLSEDAVEDVDDQDIDRFGRTMS